MRSYHARSIALALQKFGSVDEITETLMKEFKGEEFVIWGVDDVFAVADRFEVPVSTDEAFEIVEEIVDAKSFDSGPGIFDDAIESKIHRLAQERGDDDKGETE